MQSVLSGIVIVIESKNSLDDLYYSVLVQPLLSFLNSINQSSQTVSEKGGKSSSLGLEAVRDG